MTGVLGAQGNDNIYFFKQKKKYIKKKTKHTKTGGTFDLIQV